MTNQETKAQVLTSLAILKVNWDRGQDYIDNFVPFIAQSLIQYPQDEISLPELQQKVYVDFGLSIPQGPLKTILKRASRRGFVERSHDIYKRNNKKCKELNFGKTQQAVLRKHNNLIIKLVDFLEARYNLQWSNEQAEEALREYLSSHTLSALRIGTEKTNQNEVNRTVKREKDFLIASFVEHLNENDSEGFDYLETILKGSMLVDAVYFPQIGNIARSFKNLSVFLDTNFILRALGCAGKIRESACLELLELLYKLGADLRCFNHTITELRGILNAACRCLKSRQATGAFETFEHFLRQGYTPSDVDLITAKLPKCLDSLRIKQVDTPSHEEKLTVNEAKLETILKEEIQYRRDEALQRDINSATAIYRLRGGQSYYDIDMCKAIFVTTNANLAKIIVEFFRSGADNVAPIFIPDDVFATYAWLKQPQIAPDLPRKRLIADCYAALNPSDELWSKYTDEIERLYKSNAVSVEDYNILRYSSVAQNELMEVTHGAAAAFAEGTIHEVLEKAKTAIRSDLVAEVEIHKKVRFEAEAHAEDAHKYIHMYNSRMRALSTKTGKCIALVTKFAFVLVMIIGLCLTFPGILDWQKKGVAHKCVLFVLLLVFNLFILVNLFLGATVKSVSRRIEAWVSHKTFGILEKLFRP